jgi:hypothetical protein
MHTDARPRDDALKGILVTNAITFAIALWQGWSVLQLMWPFWAQSVIIGWFARQRMLKLQAFCTNGLKVNGSTVEPTPATQRQVANFFALHYGFFHFGYFFFLAIFTFTADASGTIMVTQGDSGIESPVHIGTVHRIDFLIYAALSMAFWHSHRASHLEHVQADLGNTPNIGTLMFMPYLRIIPMHICIIAAIPLGAGALWLFILLKTGADLLMHMVEHRVLQGCRAPS